MDKMLIMMIVMGGATIGPGGDMTPPLSDAGGDIIWE